MNSNEQSYYQEHLFKTFTILIKDRGGQIKCKKR